MHTVGFYHMNEAPDRHKYVIIHWNNILPGKVTVCIHNTHIKCAPAPCAHRTRKEITFTAQHCQYYVQQQWQFKQIADIAEKILDTT